MDMKIGISTSKGFMGLDYRSEDRFLVSASCVTSSNPDSLLSTETGVNPRNKRLNKHLIERDWC
jgi:hypothetical protein